MAVPNTREMSILYYVINKKFISSHQVFIDNSRKIHYSRKGSATSLAVICNMVYYSTRYENRIQCVLKHAAIFLNYANPS